MGAFLNLAERREERAVARGFFLQFVARRSGDDCAWVILRIATSVWRMDDERAKRYANAHVTGIDYWGGMWEYSKGVCERNAEIEDVANRMNFQKASATALPFEDEHFDAAVRNLVFHEVGDVINKRELLREALRVVKRGGAFAFQDLFLSFSIGSCRSGTNRCSFVGERTT